MLPLRRWAAILSVALIALTVAVPAAWAISPSELGSALPEERVLDEADVFSRASRSELGARLEALKSERVDARILTVRRLDYGFSLNSFGEQVLANWSAGDREPLLLLLLETQNKRAATVADEALQSQPPPSLLSSTARDMSIPLRDGDRYRQASLDGISRLATVLSGGEDPGPLEESEPRFPPRSQRRRRRKKATPPRGSSFSSCLERSFPWPPGGFSPADWPEHDASQLIGFFSRSKAFDLSNDLERSYEAALLIQSLELEYYGDRQRPELELFVPRSVQATSPCSALLFKSAEARSTVLRPTGSAGYPKLRQLQLIEAVVNRTCPAVAIQYHPHNPLRRTRFQGPCWDCLIRCDDSWIRRLRTLLLPGSVDDETPLWCPSASFCSSSSCLCWFSRCLAIM